VVLADEVDEFSFSFSNFGLSEEGTSSRWSLVKVKDSEGSNGTSNSQ
jgi:hypothetical protein